ncbi:oligopeptide/dipeptide ABC transporter ATP-binding protein [Anaerobranca californiensis]|uniref:ABC transporter ATP-binding protein n=1 Tax=Anaerobranca californiensis TaxID=182411 RepID=UPI003BFA6D43
MRDKYKEAQKAEEEARKAYEKAAEGEEKYKAINKLRAAEKVTKDYFLDMVQLIGGFFLAEDLKPVANILLKEHNAAIKVRKIKNKIQDYELKLDEKIAKLKEKGRSEKEIEEKVKNLQEKIAEQKQALKNAEKKLEEILATIEKMLDPYRSHPDFAKLESYRDKGIDLAKLTVEEMRMIRKDLQLIFQDPYSSLNPKMTVGQIISEGLFAHKMFSPSDPKLQDYVLDVMDKCGLQNYFVHRYPHQFSGGQRQRIGIARAVALKPKFIVCDEAVSALDVSIQSQILNLLQDLKEQENLTYLFISHDLSVIKYISDRVAVMYLGNLVELAETEELYQRPMHPYTEALLMAIPTTDVDVDKKEVYVLEGDIPSPIRPPAGCKFHTRCRYATDICKNVPPKLEEARPGHFVACHHKLNQ